MAFNYAIPFVNVINYLCSLPQVTPRTLAGIGVATTTRSINVTTLEDIPGPVMNLTLNSESSTSIIASWEEPMEPNGVIVQYR